jgi:hypothetical protein
MAAKAMHYGRCTDCMVEGDHEKKPTYSIVGLALCRKHKNKFQDKEK